MPAFPKDLVAPLRDIVCGFSSEKFAYPRPFPLPSDATLEHLLSEAYFASFKAEEGRRPGFRVMYASSEQLTRPDNHQRPARPRLIRFAVPRPYVSSEIIRIAPAAELTRVLICVHESTPGSQQLEMWGLLDVGDNWWQFIRRETSGGMPPPNHLTITSVSPGELSLSAQGCILLTLKNGAIVRPAKDALSSGVISDHLADSKAALYEEAVRTLRTEAWDDDGHDDDYPRRLYTQFLERVLYNLRARAHGGTLIVIPDHIQPEDTRISDRMNVKYPCLYDHAWKQLCASLVNHRRYYDHYFAISRGERALSVESFNNHCRLSAEKEEIDQCVTDIAQTIAALAAVDGAVLMTTRFRVYGFGVEVTCPSPSLEVVRMATSAARIPITSYGTRHRSVFRLCSSWEEALAFVVSADGGVKAVKRVGPDVVLWPDINQGAFGL